MSTYTVRLSGVKIAFSDGGGIELTFGRVDAQSALDQLVANCLEPTRPLKPEPPAEESRGHCRDCWCYLPYFASEANSGMCRLEQKPISKAGEEWCSHFKRSGDEESTE